jgi:hypothetical protein
VVDTTKYKKREIERESGMRNGYNSEEEKWYY